VRRSDLVVLNLRLGRRHERFMRVNSAVSDVAPERIKQMHVISVPAWATERGHLSGLAKPIDPATTAVVAIDFQRFFIDDGEPMGTRHAQDILGNANRINAAVRASGGLVILTQHSFAEPAESGADGQLPEPGSLTTKELRPGSRSFELHPDLVRTEADISIVKHQSSPLHPQAHTGLAEILRDHGTETVIITGLASNGCCDCLARDAFQHGYNVVVASDASAAMTDEEHNASLLNLAIYYAQVLDTDQIESALSTEAERLD
jgi:ureidoacrylate peracid hydrolase